MENINFLPENEYTEVDGRKYLVPSLPVTQTNQFIDNFRNNQRVNTQTINTQTRNLGTQVPSNLGGLTGGTGYFTSRYQTPQTNAATQNLRTAAQAQALNTALANEKAYWDKKYQDAYRAYQKRAYDANKTPQNPSTVNETSSLGIDVNSGDSEEGSTNENTVTTGPGYVTSVQGGLNIYTDQNGGKWTLRNLEGGDEVLLGGLTNIGGNLLRTFPDGTPLTNGAVYNAGGGRVFMYIQNSQYPNGSFFRVGDSPTMSYR